ncbi:MAG TPA: rhodanese-like domain-containing protein [Candidatus Nitrosocosmicus sp.]|nr:rhodanese-like domain-containing protein [Candidatus Nitrosocosmicus sp.]
MKTDKDKLEKILNLVVILAIVVVTGIIVKRNLYDSNRINQKIEIGQNVSISSIDWKQNNKTIILAVKRDCSYCTASAAYFRQLKAEADKQNITIEVVSSDSKEDSESYLAELNLPIQRIHQISLNKNGFIGTPTLLFINHNGIVRDMWVGGLNAQSVEFVMKKLAIFKNSEIADNQLSSEINNSENSASAKNHITQPELKNLLESKSEIVLIDVDPRELFRNLHISTAKNIPSDEIVARAPREIPRDKQIVFYGRCPKDSISSFSQQQLAMLGYSNVSFLAGGLKSWKEAGLPVESTVQNIEGQ